MSLAKRPLPGCDPVGGRVGPGALEHFDLDRMPGRFKLIFCFQDACPGCHATGFPALARVVDAFRGATSSGSPQSRPCSRTSVRTPGSACWPITPATRWAFPFGHDAGDEQDGAGSS